MDEICKFKLTDFFELEFIHIDNPQYGFYNYLLRGKASKDEQVGYNIIFLQHGIPCMQRMSDDLSERIKIRKEWEKELPKYEPRFIGCILYPNDNIMDDFTDKMMSPGETLSELLRGLMSDLESTYDLMGYKPSYAVSHMRQITKEGSISMPHIHLLLGKNR